MFDLERHKKIFKDHKATFIDYGNIKILDFKNPESSHYRIRFLFEEDYCRLHISGDLGELIATNYNNMTYDKFSDFVNDTGYFESKIDCHNRSIYFYYEEEAKKDLLEYFNEFGYMDEFAFTKAFEYDTAEEKADDVISDILYDFSDETGIGTKGYETLSEIVDDPWEIVKDIGKRETGIIDLYMLAFKLAQEQLAELGGKA